jgi:hypothetical protein
MDEGHEPEKWPKLKVYLENGVRTLIEEIKADDIISLDMYDGERYKPAIVVKNSTLLPENCVIIRMPGYGSVCRIPLSHIRIIHQLKAYEVFQDFNGFLRELEDNIHKRILALAPESKHCI